MASNSRILAGIQCRVCKDHSSGRHYGIFTCDGCAAFFKRSVWKEKHYRCKWQQTCWMDKVRRKQCRWCRFHKCLEAGMKRSAVQHERGRRNKTSKPGQLPSLTSSHNNNNQGDITSQKILSTKQETAQKLKFAKQMPLLKQQQNITPHQQLPQRTKLQTQHPHKTTPKIVLQEYQQTQQKLNLSDKLPSGNYNTTIPTGEQTSNCATEDQFNRGFKTDRLGKESYEDDIAKFGKPFNGKFKSKSLQQKVPCNSNTIQTPPYRPFGAFDDRSHGVTLETNSKKSEAFFVTPRNRDVNCNGLPCFQKSVNFTEGVDAKIVKEHFKSFNTITSTTTVPNTITSTTEVPTTITSTTAVPIKDATLAVIQKGNVTDQKVFSEEEINESSNHIIDNFNSSKNNGNNYNTYNKNKHNHNYNQNNFNNSNNNKISNLNIYNYKNHNNHNNHDDKTNADVVQLTKRPASYQPTFVRPWLPKEKQQKDHQQHLIDQQQHLIDKQQLQHQIDQQQLQHQIDQHKNIFHKNEASLPFQAHFPQQYFHVFSLLNHPPSFFHLPILPSPYLPSTYPPRLQHSHLSQQSDNFLQKHLFAPDFLQHKRQQQQPSFHADYSNHLPYTNYYYKHLPSFTQHQHNECCSSCSNKQTSVNKETFQRLTTHELKKKTSHLFLACMHWLKGLPALKKVCSTDRILLVLESWSCVFVLLLVQNDTFCLCETMWDEGVFENKSDSCVGTACIHNNRNMFYDCEEVKMTGSLRKQINRWHDNNASRSEPIDEGRDSETEIDALPDTTTCHNGASICSSNEVTTANHCAKPASPHETLMQQLQQVFSRVAELQLDAEEFACLREMALLRPVSSRHSLKNGALVAKLQEQAYERLSQHALQHRCMHRLGRLLLTLSVIGSIDGALLGNLIFEKAMTEKNLEKRILEMYLR